MIKGDAFQIHLAALAANKKEFQALYIFSGDEPLLMMEALDELRAYARERGYTEREVLHQDRYFDWSALRNAGQTMSLFGDKRWVELRIPTGKPGRDGAEALKQFASHLNAEMNASAPDTIVCILLPSLDRQTKSSAWFTALDEAGMAVQLDSPDRSALPSWIAARLRKNNQAPEDGEAGQRALVFMAEQVEGNLIAAHQEIQKLALLYPPGKLSEDQIRSALLKVARYDIFELTEAMLLGDSARLNRMLDGLKGEGEPFPLILWSVSDELRTLSKCQNALHRGEALQTIFRFNRIWGKREKLYPNALKRIRPQQLRRAIQITASLDRQSKGLKAPELPGDTWDGLRLVANLLR